MKRIYFLTAIIVVCSVVLGIWRASLKTASNNLLTYQNTSEGYYFSYPTQMGVSNLQSNSSSLGLVFSDHRYQESNQTKLVNGQAGYMTWEPSLSITVLPDNMTADQFATKSGNATATYGGKQLAFVKQQVGGEVLNTFTYPYVESSWQDELVLKDVSGRLLQLDIVYPVGRPDVKTAFEAVVASIAPSTSPSPIPSAQSSQSIITEQDNGKTFTYHVTDRFGVSLNPNKYPLKSLKCDPPIIGWVSNYAMNGPDNYPTGYETDNPGTCILKNGSFSVTIKVVN